MKNTFLAFIKKATHNEHNTFLQYDLKRSHIYNAFEDVVDTILYENDIDIDIFDDIAIIDLNIDEFIAIVESHLIEDEQFIINDELKQQYTQYRDAYFAQCALISNYVYDIVYNK